MFVFPDKGNDLGIVGLFPFAADPLQEPGDDAPVGYNGEIAGSKGGSALHGGCKSGQGLFVTFRTGQGNGPVGSPGGIELGIFLTDLLECQAVLFSGIHFPQIGENGDGQSDRFRCLNGPGQGT